MEFNSMTSNLQFTSSSSPSREGKQYKTKEECLKENGKHVLSEPFDPNPNISCRVMHYGEGCSWHNPIRICYHCSYSEKLTIKQREIKEWVEETK